MDETQRNRYEELRGLSKIRPLTLEESREVVSLLREGRIASAIVKKSSPKKSKIVIDSDQLLDNF